MNRRQFLTMTAAGAATLATGRFAIHPTMAEGPRYELVDVFPFVRTADGKSGAFRQISEDGTIGGYDIADGKMVPAIWDASGKQTLLDTQDIPYSQIGKITMNDAGMMTAVLLNSDRNTFETMLWEKPGAEGTRVGDSAWVSSIAPNGNMSGRVKHVPTRWIDGEPHAIDIPNGQHEGIAGAIDDAGNAIVLFRNRNDVISLPPILWRADGTTEALAWPSEVTNARGVTSFAPEVRVALGNGDFGLTYTIEGQNISGTHSAIYRAGVPESLAEADGDSQASILDAFDADFMVGGKSVWIGGEPQLIHVLLAEPTAARWLGLWGANSKREIVGVAGLDDGAPHGVVFRPIG